MPPAPLISVIVSAHDRRSFLEDALRSVVDQTLARHHYEVILVKNFHDPAIDALCESLTIESIFTDAGPLSGKILAGIGRAHGDVFAFLDYDDRYLPAHLEFVRNEFERNRSLGFLHNGLEFIDANGRSLTGGLDLHFRLMSHHRRRVVIEDSKKRRTNPRVGVARPNFNLGTIAVRREVMDLARPYLPRISLSVDSLLFCAGWTSPYSLLVDPRKLTQYRIHRDNISVASGLAPKEALARLSRFRQILRKDYAILLELAIESGRTELQGDLQAMVLFDRVLEDLRSSALSRHDAGRQLLRLAKYYRPGSLSTGLLQATACTALASVSPSLGRRLARLGG